MRFWDASALAPLLVAEPLTRRMEALLREDPAVAAWWGSPVECASALARRAREGAVNATQEGQALDRLAALEGDWTEVLPSAAVRDGARRLLRVHDLRAADALQLAAALVAAGGSPGTLPFVCADARLRAAAAREGFRLLPR